MNCDIKLEVLGICPERSAVMSFLNLLYIEKNGGNIAVNRMLLHVLTGEVCHYPCGNGSRKRIAALF